MQVTVLYVGTSLLAPLKEAQGKINREYGLDLHVAAYNFGCALDESTLQDVEHDLQHADVVFAIHVMDGENCGRLLAMLERYKARHHAVIVFNCMPDLMRRTRMGRLDVESFFGSGNKEGKTGGRGDPETGTFANEARPRSGRALRLLSIVGSWVGKQSRRGTKGRSNAHGHGQYLKLIERLPGVLRFVPTAGRLRDIKNYLYLFCYFLQPTPQNIRSMILYALKQYVPDARLQKRKIAVPSPESSPSVAIYHPDASRLFETFESYEKWYGKRSLESRVKSPKSRNSNLAPDSTIGLLLMRPQVISKTTKHYDSLIRAIEDEGLSVIPALSTLMDNRVAVERFFISNVQSPKSNVQSSPFKAERSKPKNQRPNATDQRSKTQGQRPKTKDETTDQGPLTTDQPRVSQILSLTGFSFVGGPAMNDSVAASQFLRNLNRPYRSAVSLDTQTIEAWRASQIGLNPIQAGMQIAIPEIDGATEPFVYGGISAEGVEPLALEDRCRRLARRLRRWNRLRTAPRDQLRVALVLFCFPPNKGNIGTAADLDVFPSVWDVLTKLKADGYNVDVPSSPEDLRQKLLDGNSEKLGTTTNVAYRMSTEEYRRLCRYVDEIETDWGRAPGQINSFGKDLLIQGLTLRNVFIGVQPTFGFEGDPMRLMMARGGAPHHGFMAFYTYLSDVLNVDAVIHVGTHGAMEFMPGKQVGLSGECWPDRLIGELPNLYLYSVNNPSEGCIAKRRSYAELISYLTPPVENAGLYRELAELKDQILAYRQASDERERENLFETIEHSSRSLNLTMSSQCFSSRCNQ